MESKPFWTSKTFWVNVLALAAIIIQTQTGFVIDAGAQLTILGVVNIILRAVTGKPITWK